MKLRIFRLGLAEHTKNGEEHVVVLNRIARSIIEEQRGQDSDYVFTYGGHRIARMNNSAWRRAVRATGIALRVHDLRHTFSRRLRALGVGLETRKALLGHRNGDVTTHYSAVEVAELIEAAERLCTADSRNSPAITLLRARGNALSA